MSRELLQQALDALGTSTWDHTRAVGKQELITALRAALAQPEPVAHLYDDGTWIATQTAAGRSLNDRMLFAGSPKIGVYTVATPPAAPAPAVPRHVRKIGGSFQHTGTVVADFKTAAGEPRIVLEFDAPVAGMLHVYRPDQVEPCESAAPAVREPVINEMDAVASRYAHKLALDLECVLSDYNGKWWDTAIQTINEYRMAMNRIHERESPTHMGEPVLPKHGIGGGKP